MAVERPNEAGQGQQWGLRKASDVGIMSEVNTEKSQGGLMLGKYQVQRESESAIADQSNQETAATGAQSSEQELEQKQEKTDTPTLMAPPEVALRGKILTANGMPFTSMYVLSLC